MKKSLLVTTLILAVILCFSFGVCAADNPNQYNISADITAGKSLNSDSLWVGTVAAWKAAQSTPAATYFDNGEAIHEDDIILTNGTVGIVLAVGTRNPWGYPAGSVLDTGVVILDATAPTNLLKSTGGRDNTWSIEPLVNGWDSWAPENCGVVDFSIVKYDFATKAEATTGMDAVKVNRVYKVGSRAFDVVTYYSIAKEADYAYMYTYMKNTAGAASTVSVRFAATNKGDDGGAMFSDEVMAAIGSYTKTKATAEYFVGLTMPGTVKTSADKEVYVGKYGGSVGYKELRIDGVADVGDKANIDGKYEFAKGESVTFPCAIVISDDADFAKLNEYVLDYTKVAKETAVTGMTEPGGTVIVDKDGAFYGWFIADDDGNFSFNVPQDGEKYNMYLEANGKADGNSVKIDNSKDAFVAGTLAAGADKVKMEIAVTDGKAPISAKIEVFESADGKDYVSAYPVVRFNGDSVYYNDETKGNIAFEVEPGFYKVVVYGEGYWFNSKAVEVKGKTADYVPEKPLEATIKEVIATPEDQLSADLHHHGNKNDAFSAPVDVAMSMAASGLDVAFLSDHDFTVNNAAMETEATKYNMGFLPSEEISCSWAHFNVIPVTDESYDFFLDSGKVNHVMNQFSKLPEFVAETHEAYAMITANHPWYSYGLFYAYAQGAIPGGYTDNYDTIEINASCTDEENTATLISTTDLWTSFMKYTSLYNDVEGEKVFTDDVHFLVGGSDTHDVRYPGFADDDYTNSRGDGTYASGKIRTFAFAAKGTSVKETGLNYSEAVLEGNTYVSFGPIIDVDSQSSRPGSPQEIRMNEDFEADVTFGSVNGKEQIYVLTMNGDEPLEDGAITAVDFATNLYATDLEDGAHLMYDKAATEATRKTIEKNADGTYSATLTANVGTSYNWVSLLVIDGDGNYAITNPWLLYGMFTDAAYESWYENALWFGQDYGVISGYGDGTVHPLAEMTRAEFATMVYGYLQKFPVDDEITVKDPSFSDVPESYWAHDFIIYLAERGYIKGYPGGAFMPDEPITRAEIATILCGLSDLYEDQGNQVSFNDVETGDWYYEQVMTLAYAQIIFGYPDNTFKPDRLANRAEAFQMLYRVFNPYL